jgi:hypothetical protein
VLPQDTGLQERLDERAHASIFDPMSQAIHQGRVVDAVKARLDVALHDPLIRAEGEVLDLAAAFGDRALP